MKNIERAYKIDDDCYTLKLTWWDSDHNQVRKFFKHYFGFDVADCDLTITDYPIEKEYAYIIKTDANGKNRIKTMFHNSVEGL